MRLLFVVPTIVDPSTDVLAEWMQNTDILIPTSLSDLQEYLHTNPPRKVPLPPDYITNFRESIPTKILER